MPNDKQISTFTKKERIKSKKVVEKLFGRRDKEVKSYIVYPYKALYYEEAGTEAGFPEILITVSKRNFKRAVDRNRIKRLTRESYRLQKVKFDRKIYLALIFTGKRMPDLADTQKGLKRIIAHLSEKYSHKD